MESSTNGTCDFSQIEITLLFTTPLLSSQGVTSYSNPKAQDGTLSPLTFSS